MKNNELYIDSRQLPITVIAKAKFALEDFSSILDLQVLVAALKYNIYFYLFY